jgi:hypothetical protein
VKPRLLAALTLVGVGSAIAAGGPVGLAYVARAVWEHLDLLLVALAGSALLAAVAPRGTRAAPVALALVGVGIHLWRNSGSSTAQVWLLLGGTAILMGGWLGTAESTARDGGQPVDPVRRSVAVLFPRAIQISGQAPDQLFVLAVGVRVRVDLSLAQPPRFASTQVLVTCCAARIEVIVPNSWPVVAGRLAAAYGVRFTGRLDSNRSTPHPQEPAEAKILGKLAKERWKRVAGPGAPRSAVVVIHAMGFGGEIVLVDR